MWNEVLLAGNIQFESARIEKRRVKQMVIGENNLSCSDG